MALNQDGSLEMRKNRLQTTSATTVVSRSNGNDNRNNNRNAYLSTRAIPVYALLVVGAVFVLVTSKTNHVLMGGLDDANHLVRAKEAFSISAPATKAVKFENTNIKARIAMQQQKGGHTNAKPVDPNHRVAGLSCASHGGPSDEIAAEMVYWRDIPSDANFVSPFKNTGPEVKYLTFEPDEGGWNNIRMSMETAVALAHAMGRTLVLPPSHFMYLLNQDKSDPRKNQFTFKDFFHFDSIAREHLSIDVISFDQFIIREARAGNLRDKDTGLVAFPPNNRTDFAGAWNVGPSKRALWQYIRQVTETPLWSFRKCVASFPSEAGEAAAQTFVDEIMNITQARIGTYRNKPTPVDAPARDRLPEILGQRKEICLYNATLQQAKIIHFPGDTASGARMLVHFYAFLFFQDWKHDLWMKRFVRDHLRYVDEIQCAAARVVHALREVAKQNGETAGLFDTFHIRRGDFQFKSVKIPAEEILQNIKDVVVANSTVYIATDERNRTFFKPLTDFYKVYFLDDFKHLVQDLNPNYFGMLDQRIASRGRVFVGTFYSTFTGYINRLRGYHSQKERLPGFEKGALQSYHYAEKRQKNIMLSYLGIWGPLWAREFAAGWRDIDHGVDKIEIVS